MGTTAFALLVVGGAALYFMNPEERQRLLHTMAAAARSAARALVQPVPRDDPFDAFLRARTRWVFVTPAIALAIIAGWLTTGSGPAAADTVQTLITHGANYAPRTTNGEWWRLAAAAFIDVSSLHVLVVTIGLLPLGIVLERAIGRAAVLIVWLAAALTGNLVCLWTTSPMSVSYGATAAVMGLYGLFAALVCCSIIRPLPAGVPFITLQRLAAAAAPFFVYAIAGDPLGTKSLLAGAAAGFSLGLFFVPATSERKAPFQRVALAGVAVVVLAAAAAFPFRGIVDFRPEAARIAAVEDRTSQLYEHAVEQFKLGRTPAKKLAQLIDRSIIPELQAARGRLALQRGVPAEQAPALSAASQYVQLREQSWRRRAEGLRQGDMKLLREAERTEREALDVLQRVRPSV